MKTILTLILTLVFAVGINAQNWTTLGTGTDDDINVMCVYNGELYAGGDFVSAGGNSVGYIAKWDGTSWNALPLNLDGRVYDMVVHNGALYVGGNFSTAGAVLASSIAKWDGTNWSALGGGLKFVSGIGHCYALAIHNGDLYAGGFFNAAGAVSADHLAKWNGTSWAAIGADPSGSIYALESYNNELYVGGSFNDMAGVAGTSHLSKWNDTSWTAVGVGANGTVHALHSDSTDLYIGGDFSVISGLASTHIAKWDGTSFSGLVSIGIPGIGTGIETIESYNGNLYVGGDFDMIDSVPCENVAKWDGSSWSALGNGLSSDVYTLVHYNGELHAGGIFRDPSNVLSGRVHAAKFGTITSTKPISSISSSINIYPNPFNNKITLEGIEKNTKVLLYDATGKMMQQWTISDNQQILCNHLVTGTYFLILKDENDTIIHTLVKHD